MSNNKNKNVNSSENINNLKKKEKISSEKLKSAAITGAAYDTVQRHGSAVKEHIVSYTGVDNETGQKMSKSLKSISESKTDSKYKDQNIKQQAGFSAEVKAAAKENAENAIKGKKTRTTRTDDMNPQSDNKGGTIGGKNEQYYDLCEVDKNGMYIDGSGRQLKFVGGSPEECADKLLNKKFDKYRDKGVDIEVPKDYYDKVQKELSDKAEKYSKQLERAKSNGNTELAKKIEEKLKKIEKTKRLLRKSNVTNKEALFARNHPKLSASYDIAKVSNRAGLNAAKHGAAIGGTVSLVKNTVSLIKEEISPEDAVKNIAKETTISASRAYVTAFSGSALKGAMQNSKNGFIKAVAKTNLPAAAVDAVISTTTTMKRFVEGKINGVECLEELGENGVTMIASSLGAVIGQVVIPVPVIGGLIGGMVGYALASASYRVLLDSLKEAKLAHERRLLIEAECEEQIALIRAYRRELEESINNYLVAKSAVIHMAFSEIKNSLQIGDIDGFISGTNEITYAFGKTPQFESLNEFESIMKSETPFLL